MGVGAAAPGAPAPGILTLRRLPGFARISRPRFSLEAVLDRVVRGRAWIPVLGLLLIGIVAIQVEVLKLGASVGRSMNTATELSSQIQLERAQVSSLDSPARIERLAASYGLSEPGPTDNHFVSAHTSLKKTIAGIHPVDTSAFDANLAREQASDDIAPTQAVEAANATDASTTPNPADDAATESTASDESQAASGSTTPAATAASDLTNTAADPTAGTGATSVATDSTAAATDSTAAATDSTAADATAPTSTPTDASTASSTGGSALAGAATGATSGTSGSLGN